MKSSFSGSFALPITAKTEAFLFFPEYTPGPLVALGGEIAEDITKPAADRKTGRPPQGRLPDALLYNSLDCVLIEKIG